MAKIEFTIPGKPIPWSSPKVTRRGAYSKHTIPLQKIRDFIKRNYVGEPWDGAIQCTLEFYMPIPASTSKKKHKLMVEGKIRPLTKPDRTNLGKGYEDIFQGIFYHNDSQIVEGKVGKWYSDNPRVMVHIETV